MLDIMSSPQSIDRPTMTVPSLATYSARVQASAGAGAAETTIAAMSASKGPRKALMDCMTRGVLWARARDLVEVRSNAAAVRPTSTSGMASEANGRA